MKYTPIAIPDHSDFEGYLETIKDNWKRLLDIDKRQRDKGELLWRYVEFGVGDGTALYQIVKVKRNKVELEHCDHAAPDNYYHDLLGMGGKISKEKAEQLVKGRDTMNKLFGR